MFCAVDWQELIVAIRLAQASIDRELAARIEVVHDRLRRDRAKALEACDRAIGGVGDDRIRWELERAMEELDLICDDAASAVRGLCTYDLFDPLRVLAADIRDEHVLPLPLRSA
jgi:hypothetical protein